VGWLALKALYGEHRSFAQLVALFGAFRVLAVLFVQPGGFMVAGTPDQFFYHAMGGLAAGGRYPYLDYWSEFPPIFPWLIVAAYKLSLLIPAWASGMLWFNAILRWLMLPFDVGSLVLTYATVGRLHGREKALQAAQGFALLFVGLFVSLGWFDSVVVFFVLLGLYGLVADNPTLTGLGIGLGFGMKLFPLAILPAAVRVFAGRRRLLTLTGVMVLCVVVVFGPFLIASPANTLAFFRTLAGRSPWETVWALVEGYPGAGAVAPLDIRGDPATVNWVPTDAAPSSLPWVWIALAFGALGLYLWTRRIEWGEPRRSTAFAGLTTGMMLLYAKGYSPQWNIYPAALAITLLPGMRGVFYGVAFSVLTVLEWPVAFMMFGEASGFLVAVIVARTALTIILCVEFAAVVYPGAGWLAQVARRLPALAAGGLVVAGLIEVGPAFAGYREARLADEPLRPLIEGWEADTTTRQAIITAQPMITERLTPLLPGHVTLHHLPNAHGKAWVEPGAWLDAVVEEDEPTFVWFVQERSQAEYTALNDVIDRHLSERHCKLWDAWHETARASVYLVGHPVPEVETDITFGEAIRLVGVGLGEWTLPGTGAWCVTLRWEAIRAVEGDYAVVMQMRDQDGALHLEHQLEPVGGMRPTSTWVVGDVIEDAHGLLAPLPPGRYWVEVGLIDLEREEHLAAGGEGATPEGTIQVVEVVVE
jgi:hypothetical protein